MQEERRSGEDWEEALFRAVGKTGRALLTATLTTVVSLGTLTLASFDGFREFGVACGLGVAVCLVASVLVIPPLVSASERVWASRDEGPSRAGAAGGAWVLTASRVGSLLVLAVVMFGALNARSVEFEYDFRNLSAPREEGRIRYGAALGRNRSSAPAVVLGRDSDQMREVHAELRRRLREGDPYLKGFTTIATAVPGDQAARMAMVDEIYEVLDRRAVQNIDGDEGELIQEITALTDVDEFGPEDLPEWSRAMIEERDGGYGSLGLLYGDYADYDAREVAAFQERFESIEVGSGVVRVSSNGFIISDVVRYVQADGRNIAIYVTLGLFIVLMLDLRSVLGVVVCLSGLATALFLTIAGMVVFDLRLGLYNIVVLPMVLGVGIDGAIHIYHRYLEDGVEHLPSVMQTTGVAVIAASITTAAGFVGLLMVEHKGIRTIGALAVLGIAATLVAVLTTLPTLLALLGKRRPRP